MALKQSGYIYMSPPSSLRKSLPPLETDLVGLSSGTVCGQWHLWNIKRMLAWVVLLESATFKLSKRCASGILRMPSLGSGNS